MYTTPEISADQVEERAKTVHKRLPHLSFNQCRFIAYDELLREGGFKGGEPQAQNKTRH